MSIIINVDNLKKTYKSIRRGETLREVVKSVFKPRITKVKALKGISFDIDKGELLGFIGPNGAGKSTTLKIFTGVLFPDSGEVTIIGYTPWKQRKIYVKHIGAVFGQKSQLIWDIPAVDAFEMNRAIYEIPLADYRKRLDSMVDMLSVGKVITKPVRNLSLGERMKCEFIMALLHNPQILFLDEPTIGLDVIAKQKIREFIKEINQKGVTVILTTHDMSDIEHLAQRVMVINYGEIVFDDSLEILKRYLGNRKIVRVKTRKKMPSISDSGLTITKNISPFEIECEIDVSRFELNRFIDLVNKEGTIADLAINEQPIEEIIKEIYTNSV